MSSLKPYNGKLSKMQAFFNKKTAYFPKNQEDMQFNNLNLN